MRRYKKDRYITLDLGVTEKRWKDQKNIRLFVAESIREAFKMFIEKLKKDKADINSAALVGDVEKALGEFLGG